MYVFGMRARACVYVAGGGCEKLKYLLVLTTVVMVGAVKSI